YSLRQTHDGGFFFGGKSNSGADGTKTSPNLGSYDYWVVRLDEDGNELWEQTYGGSGDEEVRSVQQTYDGGFVIGGWSASVTSCNDSVDYWVVKLAPEPLNLRPFRQPFDRIQQDGFKFFLTGKSNSYVTEFSTNLLDWTVLQTNIVVVNGGGVEIRDAGSTNAPHRF